jgi:hypothetical protein
MNGCCCGYEPAAPGSIPTAIGLTAMPCDAVSGLGCLLRLHSKMANTMISAITATPKPIPTPSPIFRVLDEPDPELPLPSWGLDEDEDVLLGGVELVVIPAVVEACCDDVGDADDWNIVPTTMYAVESVFQVAQV